MAPGSDIQPEHLLLGSGSPRRRELLQALGLRFEVVSPDVAEHYPEGLAGSAITDYLCELKARAVPFDKKPGKLLLTADTIVWHQGEVLEKPEGPEQAREALRSLSGNWHEVITSVCFLGHWGMQTLHEITRVKFAPLSESEIEAYVATGLPLDKAGAYGIQEWIGLIGVEAIEGSYTNVVGLPTHLVYKTLKRLASRGF